MKSLFWIRLIRQSFYILIVMSVVQAAWGDTYCVDTAGSDSYNGLYSSYQGSSNGPFKTPNKGMESAQAGDTVTINDGVYTIPADDQIRMRNLGKDTEPIVIKAANKHKAKIVMATTANDAVIQFGVWSSSGWTEDNPFYVTIDGLEIVGGYDHCIGITGSSYVTVKNCKLHDSGRDAIKVNSGSNHVTILNNEIYNTGARDDSNAEGIDVTSSNYTTIQYNHIHHIPRWGLYLKKLSRYGLVENNLIHDSYGGIGLGESTVCYDSIARNNVLYNIHVAALQGQGAIRCKFYNNTLYNVANTSWAGLRAARAELSLSGESKYCETLEFTKNIVVINSPSTYVFQATDPSFETMDQLTLDKNLYFNLNAQNKYTWRYHSVDISGIENWREWTGKAEDVNSYVGDPQFVSTDPSSSDFLKLSQASPANLIGAGADVSFLAKIGTDTIQGTVACAAPQNLRVIYP
jgi:hypothetical protein